MNDRATILAVDDTPASLALLVSLLTAAGYRVLAADSGELALAAVAASPPDLVLLDVNMTGIDGLEVCRRLKARAETLLIPVILVSATAGVDAAVNGLKMGAADYVSKPFRAEELLARVSAHLALSRARILLEGQAAVLGEANERLQTEINRRQVVELDLRASLDRAERLQRAMLGALEDVKQSRDQIAARVRQEAVIAELGALALGGAGLPALMDRTVLGVARVLDVEMCKVLELLPNRSAFLLRAGVGWKEGQVGHARIGIGLESQAGFTLASREPVVVEELRTESRFHGPQLLHDHGVVSGMSTVIGDPGCPYGVLGAHTTRRRVFTPDDVHFLQAVSHLLASAVQRSAHEAEIERLNHLYATLSQVNQVIVRCTSRQELFQELCRVVVEFGRFTACWVGLRAGDGREVAVVAHAAAAPDTSLTLPGQTGGCGVTAEAVRTGLSCSSNDALQDERTACCHEDFSRLGIRSCAAFPFRSRDEIHGAISLCSLEAGFFNSDEVRLLEEVAMDISFALDHLDQEAHRREAEEALRESEGLLQQSQTVARIGHYVLDVSTGVWSSSETLDEIYGIDQGYPRTVEGWLNLVEPGQREEMRSYFRDSMLRNGEPFDRDYRIVRACDGTVRWVHGTGRLELAEDGRPVRMFGVIQDVTQQVRAAEERARLEDQLRQAQKVEAVGRLAGGVAHDFNNLTAIVLGYGEMLLGHLLPEDPARRWASQIMAAGQRSAALTRQLLAFSRKQTLEPSVLDPNALLRSLELMFGRLIGEDIRLELALAPELGHVKADSSQLEQVVMNIVLNARDAMPRGGRLTVETANVDLDDTNMLGRETVVPGRYVMLSLTDTGCGMDKATISRVFEPFFTTKERGKGTGLGLAMAYGIVKQSGGYIWAYSEPGEGTIIRIYLPRTDAEPEAARAVAGGEIPRGAGEMILLVEDEASLRELCEITLMRLGYRVCAAENGLEALRVMQQQGLEPDLVLTDVIMPGMSGAELAERLRRDRPGLEVLYMSGYPDEAIARHGVLDPGVLFIQKPFAEGALASKVRAAMKRDTATAPRIRRILMIDDDEAFRELVRLFCAKRGHSFAGVDSSAAALQALSAQPFDVLLVDLNIPGTSGEQVLQEIRSAGHAAPAIVLTGNLDSADLDALLPLGVVGALEKSSDAGPLLKAIEEAVAAN